MVFQKNIFTGTIGKSPLFDCFILGKSALSRPFSISWFRFLRYTVPAITQKWRSRSSWFPPENKVPIALWMRIRPTASIKIFSAVPRNNGYTFILTDRGEEYTFAARKGRNFIHSLKNARLIQSQSVFHAPLTYIPCFINPRTAAEDFTVGKNCHSLQQQLFFLSLPAYNFLIAPPIRFLSQYRREHKPSRRKNFGGLV